MPNARAIAGQIFLRSLPDGTAVLGSIELDAGALEEGSAYVAMLTRAGLVIVPTALDAGLPAALEGQGIKAAIEAPIWYRVDTPGAVVLRAFQSFEGSNWWTVYGVASSGLGAFADIDAGGHGWLVLAAGSARNIPAPINVTGMAVSQPLGLAIWPGPDGKTYRLPQHSPTWCARYHELSQRLAAAGAEPAKKAEILAALRNDPRLAAIAPFNADPEYLAYLAAMKSAGHLRIDAPQTLDEQSASDAWREQYLRSTYGTPRAA